VDVDELLAREAIRDLVARYNANADAGRFAEVVDLFTEDATIELPGETIAGRAAIDAMFRGVREQFAASVPTDATPYLRHFTATQQIDMVDADHATSRCYFQVLVAEGLDHWGRYLDDVVQSDGRWRFARRRVTVDGHRAGSPFAT
jgi:uncharacterized protein (TIGR02246 family)